MKILAVAIDNNLGKNWWWVHFVDGDNGEVALIASTPYNYLTITI
jgi:hypothetical protein